MTTDDKTLELTAGRLAQILVELDDPFNERDPEHRAR
jgi:hypothetical protein